MRRRFALVIICLAAVLSGCGGKANKTASTDTPAVAKKQVVVTTPVLGDFVSVLSADVFDVKVLVPRNTDPTHYSLTPNDVTTIANADLLIESGNGLEPWFDTFIKSAEHRAPIINAGNGVGTRKDAAGKVDPYTWVSPSNGRVMVSNIRAALEQLAPDMAAVMQSSERAYDSQIDDSISYADSVFTPLKDSRVTYVGEPLGYYCDDVKLQCTSAASSIQAAALADLVNSNGSKAVVLASTVDQSVVNAVRSSTTASLVSGSNALVLDTLGDGNSKDYLGYQRNIADTLSAALR